MENYTPQAKADLQIHSIFSDGSLTPVQIIDEAKKQQIQIIAITDHGSIGGVVEAMREGLKKGIHVVPGIEFGTGGKRRMDILGYGFNIVRMSAILQYHGSIKNIARDVFGDQLSHQDPFKYAKYIIDLIHLANGKAVVAHPRRDGFSVDDDEILKLIDLGLDGIEVFYPLHSAYDTENLFNIAQKYNLIITGGTDFHRYDKEPIVKIGDVHVQAEFIMRLLNGNG